MTEQHSEYGIIQHPLPVASPPTYLLLIDSRVSNYQDIINSKQSGVHHIVFDVPSRPTHSSKLIKNIEDKILELGVSAFTSIGLVQHNDAKPIYEMFGRTTDLMKPTIRAVESVDPHLQRWNSISLFITMLRLKYGILYFDMMACALYSNPDWKYIIDKLTAVTGVTVRASTDDTGAASLGGDWFLESHTGLNLKSIYFTESIEYYNGILVTTPSTVTPPVSTKKLILIDHRIKEINVIINSMNSDTYALVFNYFYDTPDTILSKLRFLSGDNRYILDNFYYEPPTLPTRMDASGNHCTPCDDFDINDILLVPDILENEYMEYTMKSGGGSDVSGNGGLWPFYPQSTNITITKPVFFQRAKMGQNDAIVSEDEPTTSIGQVALNYKQRAAVMVSDLDSFYELGKNVGEIGGTVIAFECVGILQHMVEPSLGYRFVIGSGPSTYTGPAPTPTPAPAIIEDVQTRDSNLSSWSEFSSFIQSLKTVHHMTILDMMACALYANPDWKYVIDTLAVRENITIRASLDNTGWGSSEEEANWVLETNDVSLTTVYFTDKIYEWKYVLATYIDTRFNALRWNDSMYATRGYDSRLKIAAGTANFTIEAWYYETTLRTTCTLVDMGDYNYTFLLRNGNLSNPQGMSFYNSSLGNWLYAESAVVPVAQWSHVAISRSGSTFTFYINGIARQTFTNSASLYSNNSTFAISLQSPDTCLCNRMKVDNVLYDIRLWNVARSATDILMFRNRVVPANTAGLVANYLCTDNTGSLNDRTPNALHTTIQNYDSSRWSNNTVPIPNIGFLINNGYSLRTSTSGSALNAFTHFDNITYTDFSGVDLSGVNFRGADLTGCNFTNANLTNTNFENAYMISVTTTNAITTGSNITDAITNLTSRVLRFDGVDDSISAGVPSWSNSTQIRRTMTAECWFKTADTNPQKGVAGFVAQYGITPQYRLHMVSTGQLDLWLATTAGWDMARTTLSYNDALWHHFAATYNSSNGAIILYVDGVSVLSKTHSAPGEMISITNNTPIIIGSDYDGTYGSQSDRQFRGFLSDIRIWNVVRTPTEIFENYRRRLVGNEAGLLGYWKLNQGHGSGWTLYSTALDSTVYRTHGTLLNMGATPSGNWAINNLNFRPRISTLTLGPNNGVYNSDTSFSFIDPSSNSLGDFTYAVTPSTVASVSNGAETTKTIFATSGAISIPTLTLFEFPEIASLSSWQIDVSFTVTGGSGSWRALVGDMYNEVNNGRGWGLWVSATTPTRIHWSWFGTINEPEITTVALNTPYILTAGLSAGTITLTLQNVAGTYNSSLSISNLVASYFFDGNSNDSSPNNNNLTNVNSVTYTTTDYKRGNAAASFNGSNYYEISNDGRFSSDNFTIAFWIKPMATTGNHQAIASCRNGTGTLTGWMIYIAPNNNLEFITGASSSYSGGSVFSNFGAIAANTWLHIAITMNKSSSSCVFYINGNVYLSTTRTYVNNTGTNLRIGAGANESPAGLIVRNGTLMDDFRFYNKVLTSSEIGTLVADSSYTSSFSVGGNILGKGPVTIGGWRGYSGENFPGTISYVNVRVPTNQRVVTFASATTGTPATVTATQDSLLDFSKGTQTASLTVNKAPPTFSTTFANVTRTNYQSFSLTSPVSNSTGGFSFTSSNTAVATINPAVTINALQFNGTSNFVDFGANIVELGKSSFTIEFWVKTNGTRMGMLNCQDSDSTWETGEKSLYIDADGIPVFVGFGCNFIYATDAVNDNTWHHIAVTWLYTGGTSGTPTFYIDGINRTGTTHPFYSIYPQYTANTFNLGTFVFGKPTNQESVNFFNGAVCELRIWNVARSATEIFQNYRRMLVGNETGLVAYHRFNQGIAGGTNTSITTVSNNLQTGGYTGTLGGSFTLTGSSSNWVTGISIRPENDVTVVTNGTTTITVTQEATNKYQSLSTTATLTVSIPTPTIGVLTIPSKTNGDSAFILTPPTSNSDGSFSYTSSNTSVARISNPRNALHFDGVNDAVNVDIPSWTYSTQFRSSMTVECWFKTSDTNNQTSSAALVSRYAGGGNASTAQFLLGVAGSANVTFVVTNDAGTWYQISSPSTYKDMLWHHAAGTYNSSTGVSSLYVDGVLVNRGTNANYGLLSNNSSLRLVLGSDHAGIAPSNQTDRQFRGSLSDVRIWNVVRSSTEIFNNYAIQLQGNESGLVFYNKLDQGIANGSNSGITTTTNNLVSGGNSGTLLNFTLSGSTSNWVSGPEPRITILSGGSTTITATQAATNTYTSGTVSAVFMVSGVAPTIGAFTIADVSFGVAPFSLTAPSSNSNGAFVYSNSTNTSVATVTSGGVVTVVGVGTTTITATQDASGIYSGGSSVTGTLTVRPGAPTIGAFTIADVSFGVAPFSLTAPSSNSNGAFVYSNSTNTSVATVTSSGVVTVVGAGTTTITATQDASGNFSGGSSVTGTLTVRSVAPTIGAFTIADVSFGVAPFSLTAPSSNSNGVFVYSNSTNTSVATVTSSGVVTVVGAGTTTITATQDASGNFLGGSSVTGTLTVRSVAPTIGAFTIADVSFGVAPFSLTAPSSNSNGAFVYSNSTNTSVATVTSSGVVTVVGAGTTTITATQDASGNFLGGSSVTGTLTVRSVAPTIGSFVIADVSFGVAPFSLTAPSSNSNGAFVYSNSTNTSVATVTSSGVVTVVGVGTTTITATQDASGNFSGGRSVTGTLTVRPVAPTIGSFVIADVSFGVTPFSLTAPSSNSNGVFVYSNSTNTSVATVTSSGVVTVVGVGTTTITATQDASGNFLGGSSVTGTLTVRPVAPTNGSFVIADVSFGVAPFNLTAPSSNSNGAFVYSNSTNTSVATVTSSGVVTVVGVGTTTITATQDASGNFSGGSSVTGTLTVQPVAPTIGSFVIADVSFGVAPFSLTAPSSNSNGVFSYTTSNTAVATVTSIGVVTVVGVGTTTITATQDASGIYSGGSSVTGTLTVRPVAPTIGSFVIADVSFGVAPFSLTAPSSNSNGVFVYSNSTNTSVATVTSSGVVTVVGVGTTTITATQDASGNFLGGSSVTGTLTVRTGSPTIGSFVIADVSFGVPPFSLTAPSSNSNGAFSYTSSNTAVATVTSSGVVTVTGAGTTTIAATQDASGNFSGGSSVTGTLTVQQVAPTIGSFVIADVSFGVAPFSLTAPSSNSNGVFSYTTSNTAVATVTSSGVVTVMGVGTTTITATQDASGNFSGGSSVTGTLTVQPVAPTIGSFVIADVSFGVAPFSLTAPSSNSNGVFVYSNSTNTSVATVTSSGVVTVVGTGTTTITATQDASGNFLGGSSVTGTLTVRTGSPTIGSFVISDVSFGVAPFSLTAPSSNSNGAFSYTSSNTAVATVTSSGVVTVVGAGTTTITATQDASGNFSGGSSVTGTLTVQPVAPTIGSFVIADVSFGVAPFNLTAPSSNSNGVFVYSNSTNTSVATVTSSGVVTVVGTGTTTITATQDASGNFLGGSSVTGTLTVQKILPTFGTFTIPEKYMNDMSFALVAPTSNSDGAFTFSTNVAGSAIVNVTSSGVVTIITAGVADITATQGPSSDGIYTSKSVTASFTVNAVLSNFTVPSNKIYGNYPFSLTNPTTVYVNEPFIFTSSNTAVASIGGLEGRTVTIHKAGSTIINARQAATAFHRQLDISAVLVISKKTPIISPSTITKRYGDASFNISHSSTNTDVIGNGYNGDGLGGGMYTITSRNSNIVSIFDESNVAIVGVGTTVIDISQTETTNFTSGSVSVLVTIQKGIPVLSAFTVSSTRTYGTAPFPALAYPTSVSNGAILYSSNNPSVATIDSSGIITLLKAGYVNFIANQQETPYYTNSVKTTNTMTVQRQVLPLTRVSPTTAIIEKTYGDPYFTVAATNSSNGGAITYETSNSGIVGIVGSTSAGVISVVSVGSATITARREQTDQYSSDPISWTVNVGRATTTLTGLTDLSYNVTAAPFTVAASSASDGAVTYALQDPSSDVLVINRTTGLVTLRSPGSAVIVASQAQGTLYLAPASITATITVTSAGNALQGATITSNISFTSVNLEGASLSGASITNTAFTAAKLTNANLTNAVIVTANFASANLTGATLAGATITGATFTTASLNNADLSGAVLTNTAFTGSDLSGAKLTGVDASGATFANAKLNNVDLTGANIENVNFTNTSIKGAIIEDVSFSPLQKLQLLKNSENRDIGQIIIPAVTGTTVLAAISESSPLRAIENLDLATATVAVVIPQTSTSPTAVLPDVVLNVADSDKFYLPINESEFFQIEGVKYYATGGIVRNYMTNAVVEVINYNGTPVWLLAGSIVGLVLQTNTMNTAPFVVPSRLLITSITPFMPTTLPISNNTETPIVYSSSNTNIATIDASSGQITITGNYVGYVQFTATQVQNATYEPARSVSNLLFVDRAVNFALSGLNQTFNVSTLAFLDASSVNLGASDATAVFYVRMSDINNIFKYHSDSTDIDNINASDIKYYVFHRKWPTELKLNPSHAMLNKPESVGMLGLGDGYTNNKSLLKHDFIRYIAFRLFNTIHGVDLFKNETEMQENAVYSGETVRYNIDTILSEISTTSSNETMPCDTSGNKYLLNDASGNTNLCRELMRQIAATVPSRFYGNVANESGLRSVPFIENDTIQFRVIIQAAASQNLLTGVSEIPSRSYTIKLVLKNTVSSIINANSMITDSEMYPNAYPYSSSVRTYAPTVDSSGVYNIYSPPAPLPFSRFGYNGWYYTNSVAWVTVAPTVRNHIKWLVAANTATSKIGDLQYIRFNLKIHNTASLPYLMIYTQAGSSRKYAVMSGNGSLVNGTVYSFYMNFNSYAREPAYIGHTNAALAYTVGSGSFANSEAITSIAIETDSNASAGNVDLTLASIIVGELSTTTNTTSEKEYGFEAAVPDVYP